MSVLKTLKTSKEFSLEGKYLFESANWPEWIVGLVLFISSLVILCASLILMVKVLNSIFNGPVAKLLQKIVNADFPGPFRHLTPYIAMTVSLIKSRSDTHINS